MLCAPDGGLDVAIGHSRDLEQPLFEPDTSATYPLVPLRSEEYAGLIFATLRHDIALPVLRHGSFLEAQMKVPRLG